MPEPASPFAHPGAPEPTNPLTPPNAVVVTIDPETATRWLESNVKNRQIRPHTVAKYARDMAAGNWAFTGEAIKFDVNEHLLDGQHRLKAIIQSGVTVPMLVVWGLPPRAQEYMDAGDKRTAGDALNLNGVKHYNTVSSIARLAIQFEQGIHFGRSVSNPEIKRWVVENDDIHEVAALVVAARRFIPIGPVPLGYSWLLTRRANPAKAAEFFDALANNATTGKGDPRNTLLRRMASAQKAGERLERETQVNFVLRAWNAWMAGDELHQLRDRASDTKGGSVKVAMPTRVAS